MQPDDTRIELFEVGPRDGLQNEPAPISAAGKIALVDCLSRTGFKPGVRQRGWRFGRLPLCAGRGRQCGDRACA